MTSGLFSLLEECKSQRLVNRLGEIDGIADSVGAAALDEIASTPGLEFFDNPATRAPWAVPRGGVPCGVSS
jgi:hypothetical protein